MPTWRLYALLLMAAPFGAASGPLILVAVAIAVLACSAGVVDWFLCTDARRICIERRLLSDKLSLGAWNLVELRIANLTARLQRVEVRDQPPITFALDQPRPLFGAVIASGSTQGLSYHVRPPRRGDARFGDVYLRAEGPLRLVRRTFRQLATARSVRVYPNLRELQRYDLLVRRGLEADPAGRPVRIAGASTEFERVREYLPDDEFRRINWKATARRGQPMVNQFEAERSQNLVIMLDAGRTMAALADPPTSVDDDFMDTQPYINRQPYVDRWPYMGSRPAVSRESRTLASLTKLDRALNAALLLAHVASQRGDRVALLA